MKNFKNQKGITLVALVVTIIVLLILAGVSLSLVAGGDGILGRASGAANKNYNASAKEQAELFFAEETTKYYEDKYANGNSSASLLTMITTDIGTKKTLSDGELTIDDDEITLTVKQTGVTYTATVGTNTISWN